MKSTVILEKFLPLIEHAFTLNEFISESRDLDESHSISIHTSYPDMDIRLWMEDCDYISIELTSSEMSFGALGIPEFCHISDSYSTYQLKDGVLSQYKPNLELREFITSPECMTPEMHFQYSTLYDIPSIQDINRGYDIAKTIFNKTKFYDCLSIVYSADDFDPNMSEEHNWNAVNRLLDKCIQKSVEMFK